MSEEPSPYQVSESGLSPVSSADGPAAPPTAIPRVFGIIHIVYASLGILVSLASIGLFFAAKLVVRGLDGELEEAGQFTEVYDGLVIYMVLDVILKVVLGIVLLVAGIGLLKKKLWAQKVSVFWSVARIVVAVVMMLLTIGPAREIQEQFNQMGGAQQGQFQQTLQQVGNLMGIILVCVYPVLSLVFLTRKNVSDSLS